jgi:hypothetical protein
MIRYGTWHEEAARDPLEEDPDAEDDAPIAEDEETIPLSSSDIEIVDLEDLLPSDPQER